MVKLPEPLFFKQGYVTLPVKVVGIPKKLVVKGVEVYAKAEFHVSILKVEKYLPAVVEKVKIYEDEAQNEILRTVSEFVKKNPLKFERLIDEFRFVEEAENKTVIVMCQVQNVDKLYDHLRLTLTIDLQTQPTHITLYTLDNGNGIGLTDQTELSNLSEVLD